MKKYLRLRPSFKIFAGWSLNIWSNSGFKWRNDNKIFLKRVEIFYLSSDR